MKVIRESEEVRTKITDYLNNANDNERSSITLDSYEDLGDTETGHKYKVMYSVTTHNVVGQDEESGNKIYKDTSDYHADEIEIPCETGECLTEEANYGGAYDVDPTQYFTKDDIIRFGKRVRDHLNEIYYDIYSISEISMDNNILEIRVINSEGSEFGSSLRIDMRKIHKPSDIDKYVLDVVADLRRQIDQSMTESLTEDKVPTNLPKGTLVDFGPYGDLYIVHEVDDETWWVSDESDDESGWSIKKDLADRVISYPDDYDEDDEDDIDYFSEATQASNVSSGKVDSIDLIVDEDWRDGSFTHDDLDKYLDKINDDAYAIKYSLEKMIDNHPEYKTEILSQIASIRNIFSLMHDNLSEDTVKRGNKWVNVGKSGKTHGEFRTKKQADAQRRAMFANKAKTEKLELNNKLCSNDTELADALIEMINAEWDTINDYNKLYDYMVELGHNQMLAVIADINSEENKHVGQLQECLKQISEVTNDIAKGEDEGAEQLELLEPDTNSDCIEDYCPDWEIVQLDLLDGYPNVLEH